jgi:hypothetical protein
MKRFSKPDKVQQLLLNQLQATIPDPPGPRPREGIRFQRAESPMIDSGGFTP